MTTEPTDTTRRNPLSREKVLQTAVALADESGTGVPSMRVLAKRLGVEAMSLYHHFRNKSVLLDGMVDSVFAEVELPPDDTDWRTAMRRRSASMHNALTRHPWAIALMDSRTSPGRATLRHHDAVLGCLRSAGFTVAGTAHAISVLDGYIYGFTLQQLSLPFQPPTDLESVGTAILEDLPHDEFPHLAEMIAELALQPGYTYTQEFDRGLDLILDGLEHERAHWT